MYVYMNTCVCVLCSVVNMRINICMFMHTYILKCLCVYVHVDSTIYTFVCVNICIYICLYP